MNVVADGILEGGEDFIKVVGSGVKGFGSGDGGGVVEDSLGGNVVFGDGGVKLFSVLEKLERVDKRKKE